MTAPNSGTLLLVVRAAAGVLVASMILAWLRDPITHLLAMAFNVVAVQLVPVFRRKCDCQGAVMGGVGVNRHGGWSLSCENRRRRHSPQTSSRTSSAT